MRTEFTAKEYLDGQTEWCAVAGVKFGDKVKVIAPPVNLTLTGVVDSEGRTFDYKEGYCCKVRVGQTYRFIHWLTGDTLDPVMFINIFPSDVYVLVPYWCLVKVEEDDESQGG